eukprot:6195777-Pleurochrysis_carterae.AAC.1
MIHSGRVHKQRSEYAFRRPRTQRYEHLGRALSEGFVRGPCAHHHRHHRPHGGRCEGLRGQVCGLEERREGERMGEKWWRESERARRTEQRRRSARRTHEGGESTRTVRTMSQQRRGSKEREQTVREKLRRPQSRAFERKDLPS